MKREIWIPILACSLVQAAAAQAGYRVYKAQKLIGTARCSQRLLPGGGKFVELDMTIHQAELTVSVHSQSTYSAKGEPVRLIQDITPAGKPPQRQLVVTFDKGGANVLETVKGVRRTRHVELVLNAPRAFPSIFWFIRDHPSPGADCKGYKFNMDSLDWELWEEKFVGKSARGFQVSMVEGDGTAETVFDAKGYPISIEYSGGLKLVRDDSLAK